MDGVRFRIRTDCYYVIAAARLESGEQFLSRCAALKNRLREDFADTKAWVAAGHRGYMKYVAEKHDLDYIAIEAPNGDTIDHRRRN